MVVPMFRTFILACLLAFAPGSVVAATHSLPSRDPVVSITIPDGWETETDSLLIEATSASSDFYLSFMLVPIRDFTRAMKEWEDWLVEAKIKRDEASKTVQKFKFEGGDSIVTRWTATDEDGPTGLRFTILKLSEENLLFITHWGSAAAEKKYANEILAIQQSVTKLK
jgi:hypothetical protein